MLKRRLIPKLQMRRRQIGSSSRMVLVTTVQFERTTEIGDPVSQAKIYEAQAADELIFIDLDASREGRPPDTGVIQKAAEELCTPLTIGGGVRSLDIIRDLLQSGADKVAINSAALRDPELIRVAADKYGSQCIVVSIDYRRETDGTCRVWHSNGTVRTDLDPVVWASEAQLLGAGELLLTAIDRDGTRTGLDCELTRRVVQAVTIPVITSGGCGLASHFVDGFLQGHADAVSAGTYFCYKDENPMQTRSQIANAGIPIRLNTLTTSGNKR